MKILHGIEAPPGAPPGAHLLKQPVLVRFFGSLRGAWVFPGSAERLSLAG